MIATILGHLFRCLYLKGGQCLPVGGSRRPGSPTPSASACAASSTPDGNSSPSDGSSPSIEAMGAEPLGTLVRINLDWSRLDGLTPSGDAASAQAGDQEPAASRRQCPDRNWHPLSPLLDRKQHPLILGRESLAGRKKPETRERTGWFFNLSPGRTDSGAQTARPDGGAESRRPRRHGRHAPRHGISRTPGRRESSPVPGSPGGLPGAGRPDLRNVVPEDLKDIGRLLDLYGQAVEQGLVTDSEHDRLRFVAAAEHARIIGTKNPCGLLPRVSCAGGLLHFVTYDDEVSCSGRMAASCSQASGGLPLAVRNWSRSRR